MNAVFVTNRRTIFPEPPNLNIYPFSNPGIYRIMEEME